MERLLDEERTTKRNFDNRLTQQIEEKFTNLNFLISKNSRGFEEEKENKIKDISSQFEIIREQIDLERRKR